MKPFRFSAQAALERRRKEAEGARQALRVANNQVADAQSALDTAQHGFDESLQRAVVIDIGRDRTLAAWCRDWIAGRREELARCAQRKVEATRMAQDAHEQVVETQRRVRSLELFKQRRLAAHRRAEQIVERREMDELARLQFVVRRKRILLGDL